MLSRLADNLYWFGRYLQRAENTARLINVNTILSMDLPRRVELGWEPLVDLVGARALCIHGLLAFNMNHDVGFHFLGMGANLEQADMTTRILDARSTRVIRAEDSGSFEAVEWMSVLRSLTADQTYRRHVRSRVAAAPVTRFLLQHRE